jgi:NADPH-dependent 2,4-dienoyl-CoA reductase/sulfur reductase-like enzyme
MIDPAAHLVTFDGGTIGYDKLLLATGASARRIDIPGAGLENVRYLRTLPESETLRAAFTPQARVVIVGAGWIGLEAAAAARTAGSSVTVLEPQPGALYGALGPELGGKFAGLHRSHGVEFRFGESAAEFRAAEPGSAHVESVLTTSGAELPADLVLVGIGAVPNDGLARSAGLDVDNGVVTDSALRTSDPDIFAAGDVANSFLPLLGRHVRVEHWSNALNGGKAVAKSMLGQQVEYNRVPYFYSDQYDLGMEAAGLPLPGTYDQVVYRGDSESLEFVAFWLKEGRLVAGMNVNVWDVNDDIQSLIRSGRPLDPGRLADAAIPLPEV